MFLPWRGREQTLGCQPGGGLASGFPKHHLLDAKPGESSLYCSHSQALCVPLDVAGVPEAQQPSPLLCAGHWDLSSLGGQEKPGTLPLPEKHLRFEMSLLPPVPGL